MLLNKILSVIMLNTVQENQMAELLRSNGKIYVVVSVLSIIFIGIVAYLIFLDKKINRMEKMITDNNQK